MQQGEEKAKAVPNPQYPYKCHRAFCAWCGVEVTAAPVATRRIVGVFNGDGPEFIVECPKHHAVSDELEKRRLAWLANERAKFERVLADQLPNMTEVFRHELLGETPAPVASAPKEKTKGRRPAGAIPLPPPTQ